MVGGADLLNQLNTSCPGRGGRRPLGRATPPATVGPGRGPDQAAFTAFVERQGRWSCGSLPAGPRRLARRPGRFQATFLVLAPQARSVRKADSVASWLHGVALRVAARARADAVRRGPTSDGGGAIKAEEPSQWCRGGAESWPELHEEIARLPGTIPGAGRAVLPRGPDHRSGGYADRMPRGRSSPELGQPQQGAARGG